MVAVNTQNINKLVIAGLGHNPAMMLLELLELHVRLEGLD